MTETVQAPKYKTGPNMRPPADVKTQTAVPLPPKPPVQVISGGKPHRWRIMEILPDDPVERAQLGYVFLRGDPYSGPDEVEREFYWYRTRQFRKGGWQVTGWWRRRFGPATPPNFTPTGWCPVREGYPEDGTL